LQRGCLSKVPIWASSYKQLDVLVVVRYVKKGYESMDDESSCRIAATHPSEEPGRISQPSIQRSTGGDPENGQYPGLTAIAGAFLVAKPARPASPTLVWRAIRLRRDCFTLPTSRDRSQ